VSFSSIEEYLIKNNILEESQVYSAKVEFNLLKEEKSFESFLHEKGLIDEEHLKVIENQHLVGPDKIKIKFITNPSRKGKSRQQENVSVVSEKLMDTQTILIELFDRYDIIEVLGRGAMSWVYKVKESETGEIRALKILKYAEMLDEDQIKRFSLESKVIKSLEHPNIVKLYDFGNALGIPYYTMDYIQGTSLEEYLSREIVTQDKVLEIMEKMARAIHTAHMKGVIHRDLKPSNIMIDREGEPYLVDFGIAKIVGWDSSSLTRTGESLGTPAYMSPEQALGRFTDFRSDIFSLGTILYECLTRFNPFMGDTIVVTLTNVVSKDPDSPRKLSSSVSPALGAVVMKCIEKDAEKRFSSAEDLADELAKCRLGGGVPAAGKLRFNYRKFIKKFRKKNAHLIKIASIVLVSLLALLALWKGAVLALDFRGAQLTKEQKYDKAMRCYSYAMMADPWNHQLLIDRAECRRKQGKFKDALADLEKVPQTDRKHYMTALWNRGYVYLLMRKYDKALQQFEKALDEKGAPVQKIRFFMAKCHAGKGETDKALKAADRILADDPENKDVKAFKEQLKSHK